MGAYERRVAIHPRYRRGLTEGTLGITGLLLFVISRGGLRVKKRLLFTSLTGE